MKRSLLIAIGWMLACSTPSLKAMPADIDHQPWDQLLQKHVDERGRVDYPAWHGSLQDRETLDRYLAQYAPANATQATGDEEIASLINGYNAFTIHLILNNFPAESIRELDKPFGEARHLLEGKQVSLDHIEHELLRPIIGWKAHSVVVCAARSCPPLLNRAYFPDDWEAKMQERYRAWLAREDLNQFLPEKKTVRISKIFDWYSEDFAGEHSVKKTLARFGPAEQKSFLQSEDYKIQFRDYHWGLNAQSDLGEDYKWSIWNSIF